MPQIREEVVIFLAALLTGMIVRLVYIGLNVFRQIVRHNLRIMESEDLIFWIGSAFYIFVHFTVTFSFFIFLVRTRDTTL